MMGRKENVEISQSKMMSRRPVAGRQFKNAPESKTLDKLAFVYFVIF